jgi:hypothetical protein
MTLKGDQYRYGSQIAVVFFPIMCMLFPEDQSWLLIRDSATTLVRLSRKSQDSQNSLNIYQYENIIEHVLLRRIRHNLRPVHF